MRWNPDKLLEEHRKARIAELSRDREMRAIRPPAGVSAEEWHKDSLKNDFEYYHWIQHPLMVRARKYGIVIPPERYLDDGGRSFHRVLNPEGEAWLRHQLREYRDSRSEFWAKLILPLISILISLLALLVALKKR